MPAELRVYEIARGRMEEFTDLFNTEIVPAREAAGFDVIGPWIRDAETEFVWIAGYNGPLTWDEAVQSYYDSPGRSAISKDPMSMIESVTTKILGSK
ncbi:MAG: hypothetical protein ACE5GC_05320 [Acidimicrobiia bacterium]